MSIGSPNTGRLLEIISRAEDFSDSLTDSMSFRGASECNEILDLGHSSIARWHSEECSNFANSLESNPDLGFAPNPPVLGQPGIPGNLKNVRGSNYIATAFMLGAAAGAYAWEHFSAREAASESTSIIGEQPNYESAITFAESLALALPEELPTNRNNYMLKIFEIAQPYFTNDEAEVVATLFAALAYDDMSLIDDLPTRLIMSAGPENKSVLDRVSTYIFDRESGLLSTPEWMGFLADAPVNILRKFAYLVDVSTHESRRRSALLDIKLRVLLRVFYSNEMREAPTDAPNDEEINYEEGGTNWYSVSSINLTNDASGMLRITSTLRYIDSEGNQSAFNKRTVRTRYFEESFTDVYMAVRVYIPLILTIFKSMYETGAGNFGDSGSPRIVTTNNRLAAEIIRCELLKRGAYNVQVRPSSDGRWTVGVFDRVSTYNSLPLPDGIPMP